jgi:glycosyltransferase involved in cell wall biosynthesis
MTRKPNQSKGTVLFVETGMGFGGSAVSLKEIVQNLENYRPYVVFYAMESSYFRDHFFGIDKSFLNLKFTYKQKQSLKNKINKVTKSKLAEKIGLRAFAYISYIFDQFSILHLQKIIRKEDIALVHINNGFDPIALQAAIRCDVPCVVHSRGHDYAPPKKHYIDYTSRLLAPTRKIASHDHDVLNVPNYKIEVVHDTIDIEYFSENNSRDEIREKYRIGKDRIVIGMFARIIPMKGQLILLKSLKKIKNIGKPIACLFVGDASDYGNDYINDLKSYIESDLEGIEFVFAGYQNDTACFYSAADIVVHPSIDEEAFGRIIIEAWASRRPIVASDIGASIELIRHEETGLIVEQNNPSALAEALERLITAPGFAKQLAEAGSRQALNYGNGPLISAIEAIYDETIERQN